MRHWTRPFLVVLLLLPATFAGRAQDARLDAARKRVIAVFDELQQSGRFNGAVRVGHGDAVFAERAVGKAHVEWNVDNTTDTRFHIGSVTKQFTAALILQLAEEGKLDIEKPVTACLPAYPAAQGGKITVHQLLSHTSGIPNYTNLSNFSTDIRTRSFAPDSLMAVFSALPLEFEPGSKWAYSNSNYVVLGAIVEKLTGMTWADALQTRLLRPLGLSQSGADDGSFVIERMASGYDAIGVLRLRASYWDASVPYAAGAMYSTVGDLHRWARALEAGKPFRRAETRSTMFTPVRDGYACGIGVLEQKYGDTTVTVHAHSGGVSGFTTQLLYLPAGEWTVAVCDNTGGPTSAVATAIVCALYGQKYTLPPPSITGPVAEAIAAGGPDAGAETYRRLKKEKSLVYDFGENELNSLGYYYLRKNDLPAALRVFELNIEAYPKAFNPYDSYGEALLKAGRTEEGIANYRKSVELNPGNENGRAVLKRHGVEVAAPDVSVPETVLQSYVGSYQLAPEFAIAVTREGTRLFGQATGQDRFELFPRSTTAFYLKVVPAQIDFVTDASGAVTGLVLHQGGRDMPAKKVE